MFTCSQWIWLKQGERTDQYAEFYDSFAFDEGSVLLRISADSNYAVYVNGVLAASGQYPDFPHDKVYDEVELKDFCRAGINHLGMVVWFYGEGSMTYAPGRAALRYEVIHKGECIAFSQVDTLSRQSRCYTSGLCKKITHQLGFSFRYDLSQEDGWMTGALSGFEKSRIVNQQLPLRKRPVERLTVGERAEAEIIRRDHPGHCLVDLHRETVGYLTLRIHSQEAQDVLIAYGEHIVDGGVRRIIDPRDFSMEVRLRPGINEYVNPFRRLGLRYLELFAPKPVEVEWLSVLPSDYPVKHTQHRPPMDEQQRTIYDVCVRTLEMCMHDHYEDSPWREQALYAMDSRNQMLCGYYAFEEYAFARASLLLMSRDEREDGLLSICTPSADNLTIPSFSLHYFTAVEEYAQHSGDLAFVREVWPKLERLISAFVVRIQDDCIPVFEEACHWNFYEWSEGMSGMLMQKDGGRWDAALNCLLSMALQTMHRLSEKLGQPDEYDELAKRINRKIKSLFWDSSRGVFVNSTADSHASVLVNALAILCGAAEGKEAAALAQKLVHEPQQFTPATLSMVCFLYDALLRTDREQYRAFVLEDIRVKYQKMLDAGATTFWETEKGESDFELAGSLCHGWSAMPVYYYHQLL